MIRDVSTSTIGNDEVRRALMEKYMCQRRVLFCSSVLMVTSLIVWLVAVVTNSWIIISGGRGIFIPENRRFFQSSQSGLWYHCRNTVTPQAQRDAKVVRNFTSLASNHAPNVAELKRNLSNAYFVKHFLAEHVDLNATEFTEQAKRRLFAHWLRTDIQEFAVMLEHFKKTVLSKDANANRTAAATKPIQVNTTDVDAIIKQNVFGNALQAVNIGGVTYNFVIPELVQKLIFLNWTDYANVHRLIYPYSLDMGISPIVTNEKGTRLLLVPPLPPKKGNSANGYDYITNHRCKYIDMFPNPNDMRNELAFDEEVLDYIRTQASFACITVFVMCLGAVFSFYTFQNPRYMFKRLAGGIHLVAASTALVVLQVLFVSVDYTKENLFYAYPDGAELTYGYSVYLAWFTFCVNLLCGILFLWYSGKKKGAKAPTDEIAMADEPTIMGR